MKRHSMITLVSLSLASMLCSCAMRQPSSPLPQAEDALAGLLKGLRIMPQGLRPMDQAISVAGGVRFDALTEGLMLKARPGVFCAGEMLDWEAPTGGYLLTGCLASGRWAGRAAVDYLAAAA